MAPLGILNILKKRTKLADKKRARLVTLDETTHLHHYLNAHMYEKDPWLGWRTGLSDLHREFSSPRKEFFGWFLLVLFFGSVSVIPFLVFMDDQNICTNDLDGHDQLHEHIYVVCF